MIKRLVKPLQQHRESDDAQAVRNLVQEYRATLALEFVRLGSWEAVGVALGARVEHAESGPGDCAYCVGSGGYEDYDGSWQTCSGCGGFQES